jgi:hypothetical protein
MVETAIGHPSIPEAFINELLHGFLGVPGAPLNPSD